MYRYCQTPVLRSMVGLIRAIAVTGIGLCGNMANAEEVSAAPLLPSTETVREQRTAAYERMLRLLEEDRPADAVPAAFEVVELTRELDSDDTGTLVTPLTNLATAQLRAGDLLAAEGNYSAAVSLLEKHAGIVAPGLITPLTGLAQTYMRAGQLVQATESYERALHVNHVNEGFYNLEQLPLRDGLTESYIGQKELEKANFHQESQLQIMEHRLGRGNPELLPALSKLGGWYERTGQMQAARLVHQDTVRLITASKGENDPALVEPLIRIAGSYLVQALQPLETDPMQGPETLLPMSGVMLRKALKIVDEQAQPDPLQQARVFVELGDLYLIWGKRNSAADAYADAWRTLSDNEGHASQRDEYFARPVRLFWTAAPQVYPASARKLPPGSKLEPGYVLVKFAVDETGRVSSAEVLESDPAGLIDKRVLNAVRRSLYRPRHLDGLPVLTEDISLRHEFGYRIKPKATPPAEPAEGGEPIAQPESDSRS